MTRLFLRKENNKNNMAIIKDVELHWIKCDPENPVRYQGKLSNPAKWSVQIRTSDKAEKALWEKEYGMKMTADEQDGAIFWRTSLTTFAYRRGDDGNEDTTRLNKQVTTVLADLSAVDPKTIGNGSVGNVSFYVKADKSSRSLKGIQLTKLIKYDNTDDDEFEASDDFEVLDQEGNHLSEEDIY